MFLDAEGSGRRQKTILLLLQRFERPLLSLRRLKHERQAGHGALALDTTEMRAIHVGTH